MLVASLQAVHKVLKQWLTNDKEVEVIADADFTLAIIAGLVAAFKRKKQTLLYFQDFSPGFTKHKISY